MPTDLQRRALIDPRDHGALFDGVANDTAGVQAAFSAAAAVGGTVWLPQGTGMVSGGIAPAGKIHVRGPGTLKAIDGSTFDSVVVLDTAESTWDGPSIDLSAVTVNSGRNEGIRVSAPRCRVRGKVTGSAGALGNKSSENNFYADNAAPDVVFDHCLSVDAGYGGFRTDASRSTFINPRSENHGLKGINYNGPGGEFLSIVGRATVIAGLNTQATGSTAVQADPGTGNTLALFVAEQIHESGGHQQGVKIGEVGTATRVEGGTWNLLSTGGTAAYALTVAGSESLHINRVIARKRSRLSGSGTYVIDQYHGDVTGSSGAAAAKGVEALVERLHLREYTIIGCTSAAIDLDGGSATQEVVVERATMDAATSTVQFFVATSNFVPGRVILPHRNSITIITGGNEHGNSDFRNFIINRRMGFPRVFRSSQDPATAGKTYAYEANDQVLFPAPAAGGKIGAVCVTTGSPGTWKGWGAIDA